MQINFEREHNAVTTFGQAKLAFSQKSFLKRLGLGFLVQFGNQCTGALVINNVSPRFGVISGDYFVCSSFCFLQFSRKLALNKAYTLSERVRTP